MLEHRTSMVADGGPYGAQRAGDPAFYRHFTGWLCCPTSMLPVMPIAPPESRTYRAPRRPGGSTTNKNTLRPAASDTACALVAGPVAANPALRRLYLRLPDWRCGF